MDEIEKWDEFKIQTNFLGITAEDNFVPFSKTSPIVDMGFPATDSKLDNTHFNDIYVKNNKLVISFNGSMTADLEYSSDIPNLFYTQVSNNQFFNLKIKQGKQNKEIVSNFQVNKYNGKAPFAESTMWTQISNGLEGDKGISQFGIMTKNLDKTKIKQIKVEQPFGYSGTDKNIKVDNYNIQDDLLLINISGTSSANKLESLFKATIELQDGTILKSLCWVGFY